MASRKRVYGFAVFAVLILCAQVTVSAGDICGSGFDTKICEYSCCFGGCCPFGSLSTEAVIGIAVGGVVFLVLIIVACCVCCNRSAPQPVVMHVAAPQQPGVAVVQALPAYYSAQPQPGFVNPGYKY